MGNGGSLGAVYAGRFIAGLGVGQTVVVAPVYLAEIVSIAPRCFPEYQIFPFNLTLNLLIRRQPLSEVFAHVCSPVSSTSESSWPTSQTMDVN